MRSALEQNILHLLFRLVANKVYFWVTQLIEDLEEDVPIDHSWWSVKFLLRESAMVSLTSGKWKALRATLFLMHRFHR